MEKIGIGVGGEYTAIFAAIDELIPAKIRGRVDIIIDGTWFQLFYFFSLVYYICNVILLEIFKFFFVKNQYFLLIIRHFGSLIASLASLVIYRSFNFKNLWRILFLIGGIGSIPILILRRKIPESPRWLICKGKYFKKLIITVKISTFK